MIRNVCIHVENEQPLLVDLYGVPTATDAGLLCTNVRMMDGKRPVFIERTEATFFFPYHVIRFVEIPQGAMAGVEAAPAAGSNGHAGGPGDDVLDQPELRLPVPAGSAEADTAEGELEIDEGFLQRIRDI